MKRSRAAWPWCVVAAFATAVACDKPDAAPAANPEGAAAPTPEVTVTGEWPAALGPILVVPSDAESQAVVLYPVGDLGAAAASRLALLGANGVTVRSPANISASDSLHCGDAPVVRFARAPAPTWSVGVERKDATPVRSDSLDVLTGTDSSFVVSEMARLASAVASGNRARFSGIPFTLTSLRRVRTADREVVAALLVRRLNQEADPGEEHTFVIAERYATRSTAPFEAVHTGRSDGTEDTAENFDLVGVFRVFGATLFIVVREKPAATTTEILERSDTGEWRVRWTRTVTC